MRFTMKRPGTYSSSFVTSSPFRRRCLPLSAQLSALGAQLHFHLRDMIRDRTAWFVLLLAVRQLHRPSSRSRQSRLSQAPVATARRSWTTRQTGPRSVQQAGDAACRSESPAPSPPPKAAQGANSQGRMVSTLKLGGVKVTSMNETWRAPSG